MPQRRDNRFIGPAQQGPPSGGPGFVGPPQQGPPAPAGFPAQVMPSVTGQVSGGPGGGNGIVGPPPVGPPGDGFVGPPQVGPPGGAAAVPPSMDGGPLIGPPPGQDGRYIGPAIQQGGDPRYVGPPQVGPPGDKLVGPPQVGPGPDSRFVGPPQSGGGAGTLQPMGGPRPLALAPSGASAGSNEVASNDLPRGTPLQRPGFYPTGEAPSMMAGGQSPQTPPPPGVNMPAPSEEYQTSSELIQQYLAGQDPAKVRLLLDRQKESYEKSVAELQRGPIEPGDQTQNPVGYAREYRKLIKEGKSPEEAARIANARMAPGQVDRQGRPRFNVIEHNTANFNDPAYLEQHFNSGFFTRGGGGSPPPDGNIPPSAEQGEPAPYPNQGPVNEVGQDPLSEGINSGIFRALESGGGATTPFGESVENSLLNTLGRAGQLDQGIVNQRLETAQEGLDRLEQNRMRQLRATLASRGLLGQGPEFGGTEEVARDIASIGAGAFRDILADEQEAANLRFQNTLGLGTGYAAQQPGNLINAIGAGTNRQNVLSQIALQNLALSQDFNKFLATFGLERDKTLAQIEQGRIDALLPYLQIYMQGVGQARQGYI